MKYVYILKAGVDHYKVGIADNVARRVDGIQTSNPNKIYVVGSKLCDNAEFIEKTMHNKLQAMATDGGTEWFKLEPVDVIKACILLHTLGDRETYNDVTPVGISEQLVALSRMVRQLPRQKATLLKQSEKTTVIQRSSETEVKQTASDPLYYDVLEYVFGQPEVSTSMLQRVFSIGYGRAARFISEMEDEGIVGGQVGGSRRIVLKTASEPYGLDEGGDELVYND